MKNRYRALFALAAMAGLAVGFGAFAACKEEKQPVVHGDDDHVYSWTVVEEPTCTEEGIRTGVCACGKTISESVPAKGHEWLVTGLKKAATCTETGSRSVKCEVCGAEDQSQVIPALGHDWGEISVQTEPTCTEKGSGTVTCKRTACGQTEPREIPAKGHELHYDEKRGLLREATCTEEGLEAAYCLNCTAEGLTRAIPATGHSFESAYTITKMPTQTEEGSRARLCTVCGAADESSRKTIPSLSSGQNIEYEFRLVRTDGSKLGTNGVKLTVSDAEGVLTAGPTANGSFRATLPIGAYTVTADEKTLPFGYSLAASEYRFSATDFICEIVLKGSVASEETPLPSGYVYRVGSVVQDFTLRTVNGDTVKLSEILKTKAVVLNFWATWCGPCQQEFPALNRIYANYRDKVEVIAVNSAGSTNDDRAGVAAFASEYDLSFPVVFDDVYNLYRKFSTGYFPTTVLIDREGVVSFLKASAMEEAQFESLFARAAGTAAKTTKAEAILPGRGKEEER